MSDLPGTIKLSKTTKYPSGVPPEVAAAVIASRTSTIKIRTGNDAINN